MRLPSISVLGQVYQGGNQEVGYGQPIKAPGNANITL
jgi:hypothetical protein